MSSCNINVFIHIEFIIKLLIVFTNQPRPSAGSLVIKPFKVPFSKPRLKRKT